MIRGRESEVLPCVMGSRIVRLAGHEVALRGTNSQMPRLRRMMPEFAMCHRQRDGRICVPTRWCLADV
jgi:hypothetical protein